MITMAKQSHISREVTRGEGPQVHITEFSVGLLLSLHLMASPTSHLVKRSRTIEEVEEERDMFPLIYAP